MQTSDNKMKTFQDFKDHVAREKGVLGVLFESWQDMEDKVGHCIGLYEIASKLYAEYAFQLGCEAQRISQAKEFLMVEHGKASDAEISLHANCYKLAYNPFSQPLNNEQ